VDLIEDFISIAEFPGAAIVETGLEQRNKVLAIIRDRGSISHSSLLRLCWRIANAQEMRAIIDDLEKLGLVRKTQGVFGGINYDYIEKRSR